MAFIIILLFLAFAIVYSSLSWGFVFYKFYSWFVLSVFTTLPEINFWAAVGLMFFVGLFHGNHIAPKETDNSSAIGTLFFGPWITLAIGWLIGTLWIF